MEMIDLFSGIGGFSLAGKWAGIKTVAFVEINKYCRKLLAQNFTGVPIHDDIKTFYPEKYSADIISGGFPCQPFSTAAGNKGRKGSADNRYLLGEMLRVIRIVQPSYVLGENVVGLLNIEGGLVFSQICADLENEGYQVETPVLPAYSVGQPHQRNRVWFVAYSHSNRLSRGLLPQKGTGWIAAEPARFPSPEICKWQEMDYSIPALCGENDGLSRKLDKARVKGLGNSICPLLALKLFDFINYHSSYINGLIN